MYSRRKIDGWLRHTVCGFASLSPLVVLLLVSTVPLAKAVAPVPPPDSSPRIFLSYAPDREQSTPDETITPLSPFTFSVVAQGSGWFSAWEARVAIPPEVVVKRRILPGKRNLDVSLVEDNWIVGLGSCVDLADEGPLELAHYEALLLSSTQDASITIVPTEPASLTQHVPAWADCAGDRTQVRPFVSTRSVLRLDGEPGPEVASRLGPSTLLGASPNPFNPNTSIHFRLASSQSAALKIYNLAGRLVRTFDLGALSAGEHDVVWNGRDDAGRGVASAVYLIRLEAPDQQDTMRIVLLK